MTQTAFCYFLVFRRHNSDSTIDWDNPTGGIAAEPERVVEEIPIIDMEIVREVAILRYHCTPDEHLILAEVFEEPDKARAAALHRAWDSEMMNFLDLMNSP